jgi:propanol-preferring alcohol dehydrogenase
MILEATGELLRTAQVPKPGMGPGQVLVRVRACAVCRTDLHIVDGELPEPKLPLIPGHQIVGVVEGVGEGVERFLPGDRVGIPWLGWTDGTCGYCLSGRENLCDEARFTGYQLDGGYAEYAAADERFCFPIPGGYLDLQAAPLLCAGLIGYRSLRFVGDAERLGLFGFGASAHIVAQVANHQGRRVFAFTRPGDIEGQRFARELGAQWAGVPKTPRLRSWTRLSSSPQWVRLYQPRSGFWRRAGRSCALAST